LLDVQLTRELLHVFPSFAVGGSQVRFASVANHCGPKYRHQIIALNSAYDCIDRLGETVDYSILQYSPAVGGPAARLRQIRSILRSEAPDLLLTYNWGAIEWALANRFAPPCAHLHFEDGFGVEKSDRQLRRRVVLRRIALSGNSRVIVPSETLRRMALTSWKLRRDRVSYVPNGVDWERFAAAAPDPALERLVRPRARALVVGTVAELWPEKNLARLIRSVVPLRQQFDLRLVIVGQGSERQNLAEIAAGQGLAENIVFTGAVAAPERILPLFDVFVLSSDTEQLPLTVLEAMAAAKPIAAVDVGDVRAMLPAASQAYVVPRDDETKLTAAMSTLLQDSSRRAKLGRFNREHARAHSPLAAMLNAYSGLFSPTPPTSKGPVA
jgi:glycosyltransferase involved in cell wall biosynthesis